MEGGIFISVKDIQVLLGCKRYNTALEYHLTVRDALGKSKKRITIKEFCEYEQLEFDYIWKVLRETPSDKRK
jgi:hypothetical protein